MSRALLDQFPPPWRRNRAAGAGRIVAQITVDGLNAQREAWLLHRSDLEKTAAKLSRPDGTVEFVGLSKTEEWLVVGIDRVTNHNAVVMDRVHAGPPD